MKRETKKTLYSLFSLLKTGWGTLFLFGILWNLLGLSPMFPMNSILACSALVALAEIIRFFIVWKKFGNDHRVNKKFFLIRAVNWVLITFYWFMTTYPNTILVLGLRTLAGLGLIPILVLMFKHSRPCTIKSA